MALTTELRRSRERVLRSREEKRWRRRRDLPDGVGEVLSGLGFGIDGVALRLSAVPASGEADALARLGGGAGGGSMGALEFEATTSNLALGAEFDAIAASLSVSFRS